MSKYLEEFNGVEEIMLVRNDRSKTLKNYIIQLGDDTGRAVSRKKEKKNQSYVRIKHSDNINKIIVRITIIYAVSYLFFFIFFNTFKNIYLYNTLR